MVKKTWLQASGLTVILVLLTAFGMHLFPFSNQLLFPGDLASQYTPFLHLLQEAITHPSEWLYSFHNGFGSSTLSLMSYYLTSPFNLLFFIIPSSALFEGVMGLIVLKIVLSSLTMSFYLQYQRHCTGWRNAILSSSYALCGFVALYFYNILWMDVMIFFPLVVAGLERYIMQHRTALYQWSLFLLLLSNYYMGWMVCLFLGLYFFYYTAKTKHCSLIEVFRSSWRLLLGFIGRSITLVSMLSWIYLPTIQSMLSTDKGQFDVKTLWDPLWQYNVLGLSGFGMGMGQYSQRLDHYPVFYAGLLVLLLAVVYLVTKRRGIWYDRIFFIVLMGCTALTPVAMVFQLFQPTAGFPFRNTYMIIFMMIVFAAPILQHLKHYRTTIQWVGMSLSIGFMVLVVLRHLLENRYPLSNEMLYWNAGLLLLWTVILTFSRRHLLIIMAISIELVANLMIAMQHLPTVSQSALHHYQSAMQRALPKASSTLTRIDNTYIDERDFKLELTGYNNGLWFGYNGTSSYTSTLETSPLQLSNTLGLYSWNERRISNFGATPLTQYILAVQTVLQSHGTSIKAIHHSENRNAAFVLHRPLSLSARQFFANQNQLSQSLGQEKVFTSASLKYTSKKPTEITLTIKAHQKGRLYMKLPDHKLAYSDDYQMLLNHHPLHLPMILKNQCLVPITTVKKGQTVTVTLKTQQPQSWQGLAAATFDDTAFQSMRNKTTAAPVYQKGLTLTTTLPGTTGTALISVPYDPHWKATINGQEVPVQKSDLGLIQLPLTQQTNHLRLLYRPTAFWIGCTLSVIGGLIEIGLIVAQRHKSKKREA